MRLDPMPEDLRDVILSAPEALLQDVAVMAALAEAGGRAMGDNVVDLRGLAMDRLKDRLDRLEDTHRAVIAAVYENLAGTNQVHRAVLHLLTQATPEGFVAALQGDVARTLRVDCACLVIEQPPGAAAFAALAAVPPGFIARYLNAGQDPRAVTLRARPVGAAPLGPGWAAVRSEALVRLKLGAVPGLLALGTYDAHRFKPAQGTDLLAFLGGVCERVLFRLLP